MEDGGGFKMLETLKETLAHMQANNLPCAEVKLAIFLLETSKDAT